MKVLLTSVSFQDVPGKHRELLYNHDFEVDALRGPLDEGALLEIADKYDAFLCGDDEITAAVLQKGSTGKLKYISKYGVGVDKIDIQKAKTLSIPVTICPGVNQYAVAELVFGLLLSFARNIHLEYNITKAGSWKKITGFELYGKTMGIIGFGAIGKEVAARALAFGMNVVVNTAHPDMEDIIKRGCTTAASIEELAAVADVISLHIPLNAGTQEIINTALINGHLKRGCIIINTARGKLVDTAAIKKGLEDGIIAGYLADVLDTEPPPANHPLVTAANTLITPHIGSRTYQSVERQGVKAVENLINMLSGNADAYKPNLTW
ncbi:MAG TPA: phosphoglycerate dehydrogenase [Chitinophagaceae bacterium]|nr:phosphoglycerate dehydrogenase [Chitinophagaceae bacterium]